MKMTKTARPTQNPITMESGERKKKKRKQDDQYFTCTCKNLPSTGSMSANPKQFAAYFWVTKGSTNLSLPIFKQKAAIENLISILNFTDI